MCPLSGAKAYGCVVAANVDEATFLMSACFLLHRLCWSVATGIDRFEAPCYAHGHELSSGTSGHRHKTVTVCWPGPVRVGESTGERGSSLAQPEQRGARHAGTGRKCESFATPDEAGGRAFR